MDQETSLNLSETSYSKAVWRFVEGMVLSVKDVGGPINSDLRKRIQIELQKRLDSGKSNEGVADAQKMFDTKMIRVRPRFMGALASYALLSGLSNTQILNNKGTALFRLMWFLGSAQDDFIDDIPKETIQQSFNPEKLIKRSIFGNGMEFYNACYTVLGNYIEELDVSRADKHDIKKRVKDWYDFLAQQETDVLTTPFEKYDFKYCVSYREKQNHKVGSLLVYLLNGNALRTPRLQALEDIVPQLSYRMQVIDDIADLVEDLDAQRPSYAVGALIEHPNELQRIQKEITQQAVKKVTPEFLKTYAPDSFACIMAKYTEYGASLEKVGTSGELLKTLGNHMFTTFPAIRDIIYNYINKSWANF